MRTAVAVALLWLTSPAVAAGQKGFEFFEPLNPPRDFQVMAARGMARHAPPNTSAAVALAIDDGLEWVALDVRLAKDAQHVLFEDSDLSAKSNGVGPVKERTVAELKRFDAGSWFARRFASARLMTLAECFALAKGKINVCLVCRDVDPELLVKEIKSAGVERQVLVFDRLDNLERVRELSDSTIAVMPKWQPQIVFDKWLDDLRPAAVEIDADDITRDVCRRFHDRGIKVEARMLGQRDNPRFWDKVLSDGADYLQTDFPEEIIAHVLDGRIKPRPVRLACHRGASRYAPENTLSAFEKAHRLHADFVEFDVRPSSDGKFFLLHDAALDRTTNGKGPIRQSPAEAIEALDAGSWFGRSFVGTRVPSLDAFLAAVPPDLSLYFDAKDIPPQDLAAALSKYGLARRTVVYQSAGYLEKLKQVDPQIRALPPAGSAAEVTALAAGLQPYAVDTRWTALSKEYIDHCHAAGIQVFADAPFYLGVDGYRQAIRWGIDLIQTDHPLRAWRAMELEFAERAGR
jgi:glycerophosphoryl diester phosphodiesterase